MIHRPIQPSARRKSILALGLGLMVLATAAPVLAAETATGSLTVVFQGLKTRSGAVLLSLSASEAAYDGKAPPAAQSMVAVTGDTATATFAGLAPGQYAVKAFHDLDGDGKLGTNPFGVPTEPYAFSNNARAAMGPPKWSAAAFEVKPGANTQTIAID